MTQSTLPSYVVTPSQLGIIARSFIRSGLNLLVVGEPGIGKTAILKQAAADEAADLHIWHPSVSEPTDYKGLPVYRGGEFAEFLAYGALALLTNVDKRTVVFLDDLGQATPAVQAALMQLLHERAINGQRISDLVTFVAATNGRSHKAGVTGLLEPVKSRFASIVNLVADLDEWTGVAMAQGYRNEVIAFNRLCPEHLSAFKPTADLSNSPSPRTWEHVSQVLNLNLPDALRNPLICGAIGAEIGVKFIGFLPIFNEAPNIDAILMDPAGAPIPTVLGALHAVAAGLARRIDAANIANAWTYLQRLDAAGRSEFVSFTLNAAQRRDKSICKTATYNAIAIHPIGKLIQSSLSMAA